MGNITFSLFRTKGSQSERAELRDELAVRPYNYNVIVTTYNMIGTKQDRAFLRRVKFKSLILDEGREWVMDGL